MTTAKIEIYNDNGDLVNKYKASPHEEWVDYCGDYAIHKCEFRFTYAECVPKCRKGRINDKTCKNY